MNTFCEYIYEKMVVRNRISRLLLALHRHESITYFHSCRTAKLALQLAYGDMDINDLEVLCEAALLHDMGKLMIDRDLLRKPKKLTPSEYDIIKQHAGNGATIVRSFGGNEKIAYLIANHHPENNNTHIEYSDPLLKVLIKADNIDSLLKALIKADNIDAWVNKRPYKAAFPKEQVIELLFQQFPDGLYNERAIQFIESR